MAFLTALIISDSHGNRDRITHAVARTNPDAVLFLGDGLADLDAIPDHVTLRAVRGNCDHLRAEGTPESALVEIGGYRLFLTHGHREGVKYGLDVAVAIALANGADALLYGHTHRAFERLFPVGATLAGRTLTRPFLILCPGALGDTPSSFATLTLSPQGLLSNLVQT